MPADTGKVYQSDELRELAVSSRDATGQRELSATATVVRECDSRAGLDRWEHTMSRAPLVLSAAAIFCTSSFLALADEKGAIASAVESGRSAAIQKSAATQGRQDYRSYRHYRGYDETPSATIVSSHPV